MKKGGTLKCMLLFHLKHRNRHSQSAITRLNHLYLFMESTYNVFFFDEHGILWTKDWIIQVLQAHVSNNHIKMCSYERNYPATLQFVDKAVIVYTFF